MEMLNKRLCFTINQHRTLEEIRSFRPLLSQGIYQGIEIFYPFDTTPLHQEDYVQGVFELLEENPEVVLHLPFGENNDLCHIPHANVLMERLSNGIRFGEQFKVNKYTLHLGYVSGQDRGMLCRHLIPLLQTLCDQTSAYIMIENMPRETEMGFSPQEIKTLIEAVKRPNITFIFDTGHANVSGYTIQDYMDALYPKLMHMHLSDNRGQQDEHKPIGYGTVDFRGLLQMTLSYQQLYCLEILYQTVDDLWEYAHKFQQLFN
ncbi:MAG: sugar phosphate isomerase/epimerase family protein [Bacilli bacterium]